MRFNHINYPDENGLIYCRKFKSVNNFSEVTSKYCSNCEMFAGSAQGNGVECNWVDKRQDLNQPYIVVNPQLESQQLTIHDYFVAPPILKVEG